MKNLLKKATVLFLAALMALPLFSLPASCLPEKQRIDERRVLCDQIVTTPENGRNDPPTIADLQYEKAEEDRGVFPGNEPTPTPTPDDGKVAGASDETNNGSVFWGIVIALLIAGAVIAGIVLMIPKKNER